MFERLLVIAQFTLSTVLVISTWIVYDQLNYLKNKDLGFDKENVITMTLTTNEMVNKVTVLKERIKASPDVIAVGSADNLIGNGSSKVIMRVESTRRNGRARYKLFPG